MSVKPCITCCAEYCFVAMTVRLFLRLSRPQGSAASVLVEDVLQLVLRGAHDSIPNVRFTAVRALQEMAPHLDAGAVDSQVRF